MALVIVFPQLFPPQIGPEYGMSIEESARCLADRLAVRKRHCVRCLAVRPVIACACVLPVQFWMPTFARRSAAAGGAAPALGSLPLAQTSQHSPSGIGFGSGMDLDFRSSPKAGGGGKGSSKGKGMAGMLDTDDADAHAHTNGMVRITVAHLF